MERNKEIATSANLADSLTEQQCDVLEWASDMRHVMHKNSEALYDVNAPKHKEIKAFISDTYYSQNPNNLNKRLKDAGLPLIKWSFDDTRIPTNELAMILDNRRLEKSRKRQCIRTLEKANADIENYFVVSYGSVRLSCARQKYICWLWIQSWCRRYTPHQG